MTQEAEGSWFALAYLRCKSHGQHQDLEGLEVQVSGASGKVTSLPFASRSFPTKAEPVLYEPVTVPKAAEAAPGYVLNFWPLAASAVTKEPLSTGLRWQLLYWMST